MAPTDCNPTLGASDVWHTAHVETRLAGSPAAARRRKPDELNDRKAFIN